MSVNKTLNAVIWPSMDSATYKYPDSFTISFIMNYDIHTHFTRGKHDIHQLTHRTNVRASCIKISGMKIWNKIPTALRSLPSVYIFKSKYKQHIHFQHY